MRTPNTARIEPVIEKLRPLTCRARARAEEREGQGGKCKTDRSAPGKRSLAVRRENCPGNCLYTRILRWRREQLPEVAFANAQGDVAALISRTSTCRMHSGPNATIIAGIAFCPVSKRFEISVPRESENETAFVLQNCPMVGNDADTFLGDRRRSSTKMPTSHGQPGCPLIRMRMVRFWVELGKAAGLEDVGEHIGGDFGIPLLQAPHAVGGENRRR